MIEWIILVWNVQNMNVPVIRQLHRYETQELCEVDKRKIEGALVPKDQYVALCQPIEDKI